MSGELRMLDSIYAQNLPAGADAYLGYPDGFWPDYNAIVARFPGKPVVSLTVYPGVAADGCDCESGDLTIAQAAEFARERLGAGEYRPIVYAGAANMLAVIAALGSLRVARSQVRLLSAHYGAGKHICGPGTCGYPQADGTQWRDNAPGVGGSLVDESLLASNFFNGPPKPRSPKMHPGTIGDIMFDLPSAGATKAYPVPTAVLLSDGMTQIGPPSVIRFASNSPASLEYMLGDSGTWVPVTLDYARSPTEVPLAGAAVVKVHVIDAPDPVTGDFA